MSRFLMTLMLFLAVGPVVQTPPALAQQWLGLPNSMIKITYVRPINPSNQATYARLKERQVLEELSAFLSPLYLPYELRISTVECGVPNSYYTHGSGVYICYELSAYISRMSRTIEPPKGFTRQDVIVGVFVQIALHEVGHAVFDMLKVPVFGREEDAADQIAAFVMLNFGKDLARRTLTGAEQFWQAIDAPLSRTAFADEHGTPLQRFYNLLCIAYGGQPDTFKDLVEAGMLPKQRAARCGGEYEQAKLAFTKTIWPHVHEDLLKKVQSIEWAKWEAPSATDELIIFLTSVIGAARFWVLVATFFLASIISGSLKDLIRQLTTFHLVDFRGRLDRRHWWTYMAAATSAALAIDFILALLNGFDLPLVLSAVITALSYFMLALWWYWQTLLIVRRLHDRNIRGWLVVLWIAPWLVFWMGAKFERDLSVLFLLSLIPCICIFVALGFLRGTQGENRYGPQSYGLSPVAMPEASRGA
jgi:uncharacterized membrane protein YhaH (DUF805 family)